MAKSDVRRRRMPFFLKIILGIILVAVIIIGVRMATLDITVALTVRYELPELPEIELTEYGHEKWAAALNGKVIDEKNGSVGVPIASTAKIITALMVMEKKPFEPGTTGEELEITAGDYERYQWYVSNNGSVTEVKIGEKISEYDALSAMLIASSNNMADTLASFTFSSLDEYSKYANEKLREWGFSQTKVGPDASGYNGGTISTASEMARLGKRLLEQPVLREIAAKKTAVIPVASEINNTNLLLGERGIAGIKTGYNGDNLSGYCLVSGYFEDDEIVTIALLGAKTRQESFSSTLDAVKYLQSVLIKTEFVKEGQEVGYYDSWWMGQVPIVASKDLNEIGWKQDENTAQLEMNGASGNLKVSLNGELYDVPVSAINYIEKPSLLQRFLKVMGWM
ncbi:D-alanyl-D-alanine carboxypeptidase [Candidatus Saccharibacteria bacterium]|nr:D-alanyl-D-alanine carboxypeptidase [Candidatus Saccharibacteria bacterium]